MVVRTPANPGFHWGNFVLAEQTWVRRPLNDPRYPATRLYRSLGFADAEIQIQVARPSS